MMKKVKFIKRIRAVYITPNGETWTKNHISGEYPLKEGTGIELEVEADFIDWGLDTDERFGSWTIAIVQLEDGSIEYVHPLTDRMKFITDSCGVEIKHDKAQDELTISDQEHEIITAANEKNVSKLSIHIAKHFAGNKRSNVYRYIDSNLGKQVQVIIQ